MRKKKKNDVWAHVKIGQPPLSYNPFDKALVEKLEHANKYGLAEIDEEDSRPKAKTIKLLRKSK